LIAFTKSGFNGVRIVGGTGNSVLGNQFFSNTGLGINLGATGVTANDINDVDVGANNLQNFPSLTSAQVVSNTQIKVNYLFNSTPNSDFRLEFFSNTVQDVTAHGEGQTYLGFANVHTDGAGNSTINTTTLTVTIPVPVGSFITATATKSSDATFTTFTDTSEFAQNVVAFNTAPVLNITKSPALDAINEDAGLPLGAVGTLVSKLVDFASPTGQIDNVTDPDSGTLLGIAVTAVDTTNGSWWYSTNGGTNWTALNGVSDSSARLLAADANTRLYFQPNANFNGTLANSITFRAWDQTSGTNGSTVNLIGLQTVADQFTVASYSNNNGTLLWSSAWVETDSAGGGATGGSTLITGGELRVEAAGSGTNYIYRQADLTGATTATLSFNYHSNLGAGDRIDVQVSNDGGATYTTPTGGVFNNTNTAPGTKSIDMTAFISSNTRIRFIEVTDGAGGFVYFDNVQISYTTSTTGGATAYSIATDTASLTVAPVADTPSVTNATTNEDTQTTSGLVISRNAADSVEVTHFKIIGIINGTLFKNDGITQINNGTFITFAEGNAGLKFTPNSNLNGSGSFTIQASTSNSDLGLGGNTVNATITVTPVNDAPIANSDSASTYTGVATNINVVANDTDAEGNAITVLDVSNPLHGTTTVSGGTVTYTSNAGYAGADSFKYLATDSNIGLTHYWKLDGNATDSVGTGNGTIISGPTTVAGYYGDALSFNEVDNYVLIPDFAMNNEFSVSFNFKIDDNSGSSFQYIYSHGDINGSNSLNVFLAEAGNANANTMRTVLRDSNDTLDNFTLDFDASAIIGDGQWHTYTVTASVAGGVNVYLDGTLRQSDSTRGGGSFNPATGLYLGARQDLDPNRYFGGNLDSVAVYNRQLSGSEVSNLGIGGSAVATVSMTVNNAPPVVILPGGALSYTEGNPATVIDVGATVTDSDSANFDTGTLTVDFTANATVDDRLGIRNEGIGAGQIGVSGSNVTYGGPGNIIGSFTGGTNGSTPLVVTLNANATPMAVQALARNITFQNISDAPSTLARTVRVTLTDGIGGTSNIATKTINVISVNDAPVLGNTGVVSFTSTDENTVSTPMTVSTLLASALWSDVDSGALKGIAVIAVTGNGTWQYSTDGTNWIWASVSATNALLLDGATQVRYQPNSNNGEIPTFQYRAWDQTTGVASSSSTPRFGSATATTSGGTTAYSTQIGTANITLTNVNDAPLLDNTGTMTLTTINEDQTNNAGQTVASIILSAGGDRITDVDASAVEGIAISAINSGNGTWQYSIDGGTNWNTVGPVSNVSALLLRSTDLIRYDPNGQDSTTADFIFRAWDQSSGASGTKVSVLSSGGTSAFSTLIETASLTVTAVNDTPTINAIVYANINEGGNVAITSARLQVLDVDNTAAQLVYTVTVIPTEGGLLLNGMVLTANATFTQADINAGLVTYLHNGSELNSDKFTFTVSDGAGGSIGATNYVITINPINDAPTAINLNTAESYTEDALLNLADITVADLDSTTATAILTLSNPVAGSLNIGTSGSVTSTYNSTSGVWTASGAIADVNALLASLTFTPSLNFNGNFTIAASVIDGTNTINGSKNMTGVGVNDTPTFTNGNALTITNPGFENPVLGESGATNSISGWTTTGANTGVWNPPNTIALARWSPEGQNIAYIDTGGTISQTLTTTFSANTSYVLTVVVGDELDGSDTSGWQIRLYAGSQLLGSVSNTDYNPADGTFKDAILNLDWSTLTSFSAFQGQPLRIELYDSGTSKHVHFDNVRLTSYPRPEFTEGGSAVVLAPTATINDTELSSINNFNGTTLMLTRNGGSSSQDIFSATRTLNTLTEGGNLVVNSVTVGTVTTNSNGILLLTFNSNATQTHVNSVLQQIAYSNNSDAPPMSIPIKFTFNDGNSGTQGAGGALQVDSIHTVAITPVNDAPTTTPAALTAINEDSGARLITQAELLANALDIDGDALSATGLSISSGLGSLIDNGNGTWTYTPALNDDSAVSFSYTVTDGTLGTVGTANLDLAPVNKPVITPEPLNYNILFQDTDKLSETDNFIYVNPTLKSDDSSTQQVVSDIGYASSETKLDHISPKTISDLTSHINYSLHELEQINSVDISTKKITYANSFVEGSKRTHSGSIIQAKKHKIFDSNYNIVAENAFLDRMENIHQQIDSMDFAIDPKKIEVQIMLGTTVTLTAGFVSWILRGGALLKSFLLTVPLLNRFDPVPILKTSNKKEPLSNDPFEDESADHSNVPKTEDPEKSNANETK
jgi:Cadherin-like domain/Cadherin-like/Concanavalin A-like lectin/glucanases superfamily/Bacterial Ig domain